MRSILIADTTREERIAIVAEALDFGELGADCSLQSCSIDRYYQPYIDGEVEMRDLNMRNASSTYELGGQDRGRSGRSCGA